MEVIFIISFERKKYKWIFELFSFFVDGTIHCVRCQQQEHITCQTVGHRFDKWRVDLRLVVVKLTTRWLIFEKEDNLPEPYSFNASEPSLRTNIRSEDTRQTKITLLTNGKTRVGAQATGTCPQSGYFYWNSEETPAYTKSSFMKS